MIGFFKIKYKNVDNVLAADHMYKKEMSHFVLKSTFHIKVDPSTLCLLVSSVDNLCKRFGPRPGPTKWSGYILFDTLMVWKNFSEKLILKKISRRQKSMQNYPVGKELKYPIINNSSRRLSKIWHIISCELSANRWITWNIKLYLSHNMWFPTMWYFDKCRLRWACAVYF